MLFCKQIMIYCDVFIRKDTYAEYILESQEFQFLNNDIYSVSI